jgi:hypothetical protein
MISAQSSATPLLSASTPSFSPPIIDDNNSSAERKSFSESERNSTTAQTLIERLTLNPDPLGSTFVTTFAPPVTEQQETKTNLSNTTTTMTLNKASNLNPSPGSSASSSSSEQQPPPAVEHSSIHSLRSLQSQQQQQQRFTLPLSSNDLKLIRGYDPGMFLCSLLIARRSLSFLSSSVFNFLDYFFFRRC